MIHPQKYIEAFPNELRDFFLHLHPMLVVNVDSRSPIFWAEEMLHYLLKSILESSKAAFISKPTKQKLRNDYRIIFKNTLFQYSLHSTGNQRRKQIQSHLRKVLLGLLDIVLNPQQDSSLPLVQLAELIKLEQLISELFLVTSLHSLEQVHEQLVLTG